MANSCIGDAFKVDPSDKAAVSEALGSGQNLLSIYSVYEKLRGKSTPSTEGPSSAAEGRPRSPQIAASEKSAKSPEAEELKQRGNVAMQKKDYPEAIKLYGEAIDISPTNPIYLSNRAAAYSATKQHELAKNDAEMATASDPKYTKAWSRLGLARFALGDSKGSMEAYKNGIEAEGNGGSDAMKKGYETARRRVEEDEADDVGSARSTDAGAPPPGGGGMPDIGSLASMLGGAGGGGAGGGGMPDLSQLMNNPMMRQMAQSVMSNPDMLNNIMSNPQLRNMANQFGGGGAGGDAEGGAGRGGGGGPDLSAMMNDPAMQDM